MSNSLIRDPLDSLKAFCIWDALKRRDPFLVIGLTLIYLIIWAVIECIVF